MIAIIVLVTLLLVIPWKVKLPFCTHTYATQVFSLISAGLITNLYVQLATAMTWIMQCAKLTEYIALIMGLFESAYIYLNLALS